MKSFLKKTSWLLLILWCVGTLTAQAGDGKLSKELQKAYKKECKELKKEGWKVYDNPLALDAALLKYYQKLEQDGGQAQHIVGTGQAKKVNTAYTKARTSAMAQLASMRESQVEALVSIEMSNSERGDSATSRKDVESQIRSKVEQTIKSLAPLVTLCRTLPDGMNEIRMYYVVKF